jgi:CelD/BcsL family acetyltransferase involved in cellulose biosynthesis
VLNRDLELEAIGREWDQLVEDSDQRAFFLRWAWNRHWWRILRPPDSQLFILTCRDERETLVGLAPVYLRQRRTAGIPHVRELLFLGTGIYAQTSEYLDIVSRRGWERVVAEAIVGHLERSNDWDILCLREVPASSAILPYVLSALGQDARIEVCNRSYSIDTTVDWETFVSGLSTSARKNVFYRTRKLFSSHECRMKRVEAADELEDGMTALVRLHQARWQSKGQPGAFALPNVEEFLRQAARTSLADGRLGLLTLDIDGKIAAARLDFIDNRVAHAFQSGFDPAFTNKGLGGAMNGLCVRRYIEDDWVREYDLMGGGAQYKLAWTKDYKESVCLTFVRPGSRSAVYKSIESAKAIGRSFIRATVPEPIKAAGHRLINHRHYK